jgi:hypothetical protein
MSGLPLACAPAAKIALTADTVKTVLAVTAPSNRIITLERMTFGFFGISSTAAPVEIWLRLMDSGGTATAMTIANYMVTPRRRTSDTLQSTCRHTFTVEPTTIGGILLATAVHPQSGLDTFLFQNLDIEINGADSTPQIGLRMLAAADVSVLPTFWFRE